MNRVFGFEFTKLCCGRTFNFEPFGMEKGRKTFKPYRGELQLDDHVGAYGRMRRMDRAAGATILASYPRQTEALRVQLDNPPLFLLGFMFDTATGSEADFHLEKPLQCLHWHASDSDGDIHLITAMNTTDLAALTGWFEDHQALITGFNRVMIKYRLSTIQGSNRS